MKKLVSVVVGRRYLDLETVVVEEVVDNTYREPLAGNVLEDIPASVEEGILVEAGILVLLEADNLVEEDILAQEGILGEEDNLEAAALGNPSEAVGLEDN